MFKVGDKVKTADGRDATIICTNVKNEYPVWAVVTQKDSSQILVGYTLEGKKYNDKSYSCQNLVKEPEYEWQWLYLHNDGYYETTGFFKTEESMRDRYGKDTKILYRIEESKKEVKHG